MENISGHLAGSVGIGTEGTVRGPRTQCTQYIYYLEPGTGSHTINLYLQSSNLGAREMTQRLRAPATLPEDPGLIPAFTRPHK